MNLILRVILAGAFSLPVAALFSVVGMGIFFLTPFASPPLFGRLPGVSERFCPEGSSLLVERYSRSSRSQAKNDYRVICLDSAGDRVADVSNQANLAALGVSAMAGYLIAWLALLRWVRRLVEEKTIREKWLILGAFSAGVALLVWGAIYVYRQPTNPEREQAMMVVLAVVVVFGAVFLTAHHYLYKRIGRRP
jgi:hypothetical protein